MKVSEWLRQYQLTGEVPDCAGDEMIAFWAGWLIGACSRAWLVDPNEARETAIKVAEFIEERAGA